ncbi:MAG TPA: DNA-processing protein DprA [Acidimicrobiales bacterium]|nr:DNA-processing protein DprA [Acidimicrobiales bacterium]
MSGPALPAEAYAAALAALPGMGPARLAAILRARPPGAAWRHVVGGRTWSEPAVAEALGARAPVLVDRWRAAAAAVDPAAVWAALVEAQVGVAVLGSPAYPPALAGDVEPPAVVFHRGAPEVLAAGPRVAVVGTRRCSSTGAGVAYELGRDLAAAGVTIVSGLAAGVDGAAHRGALAAEGAPPVGVVGTGLDVVYPPGQGALWRAVAEAGVLLSEAPLGARPERWRFPARNRIIAALADRVVVVESHRRGGSLHTVDEADRRGVDVLAVPGSVRNPAATGTNELLAEGRAPACSAADVLLAIGLGGSAPPAPADGRPAPSAGDAAVLEAFGWQPATLDHLVLRTGRGVADLAPALARLGDAGWISRQGGWYERVAACGPVAGAPA